MRLLLDRSNHRSLPGDYDGDVLLWDIDKTYLNTHFSSIRGLAAIPFELAIDKESIPGAVPLLRALRRGPGPDNAIVPLYFISGSPIQLRAVIERRMTYDGVDFDGITFKDQLGLLKRGRVGAITEQVGYKLTALLLYRREIATSARWYLFGDDVEADAEVFLLYGRVCAGLRGDELRRTLKARSVGRRDIANLLELTQSMPVAEDPVQRVFIHLARGSDPSSFSDPRIVATRSYLQTVMVLCALGKVRPEAVAAVAADLRRRGVPEQQLAEQRRDAERRLDVPAEMVELSRRALQRASSPSSTSSRG